MLNHLATLRPAIARATAVSALSLAALTAHANPIGTDLGRQPATTPVSGTVWLQLHNKPALDAAVKAMYTKGSPTFHQFLTLSDIAKYTPTTAELEAVKAELTANHITIVSTDKLNLAIKVTGQSSDFENAFHTTIGQYRLQSGEVIKSFSTAPTMRNGASGLFHSLTGVGGRNTIKPGLIAPISPATGKQAGVRPVATSSPAGQYWSPDCLYSSTTTNLGTGATTASYTGFVFGAPYTNSTAGTVAPCGYSPADIYNIYGLNTAYQAGYTGQGQSIAIVDAYGSPTITQDLASFNHYEQVPTSLFNRYETATITATDSGWATETTLDVEWAHAIAPSATINLIATPTNADDDLQTGVLAAIENNLGNTISNSYSASEYFDLHYGGSQDLVTWDNICELASSMGISANFATGDDGDLVLKEGHADIPVPADDPYATGVGGTSTVYSPLDESTPLQTGWGTNIEGLLISGTVQSTPYNYGFQFGAGGGVSQAFALPSYQSQLSGSGREVPDVSANADPDTGCEIIQTVNGSLYYELYGGTSLATPIFSGEWALINQANQQLGRGPIGQAAPLIAEFSYTEAISDVLPGYTPVALSGSITNNETTTNYAPAQLVSPETNTGFFSAYWADNSANSYAISFGTDTSLQITPGYDNVTGWGTLNMPVIFNYIATLQ